MSAAVFVPSRRTSFPIWATIPAYAFLYSIGVPLAKALSAFAKFPSNDLIRRQARFGDFGTYRPNEHDVLVCSYFKSGTYLMLQIAVQIAGKGRAEYEHIHDIVPWPDNTANAPGFAIPLEDETPWRNSPTGLRVIKTHLSSQAVPLTESTRYIAVVRDPKSVCVSGYHFMQAFFGPMMPTVDRWTEMFLEPNFVNGDWAVHLAGYWALRDRPNVLFMTYEDLTRDPPATVRRVADFVGVALTSDEVDAVVRQSSFAHMKAIAHKFNFVKMAPWSKPEGAAVRLGQRNGSEELLSPELQKRIDNHFRVRLKELNCNFPYDQVFGLRDRR